MLATSVAVPGHLDVDGEVRIREQPLLEAIAEERAERLPLTHTIQVPEGQPHSVGREVGGEQLALRGLDVR